MHSLERQLKFLDTLVYLRHKWNDRNVVEISARDGLLTGEYWILQLTTEEDARDSVNVVLSLFNESVAISDALLDEFLSETLVSGVGNVAQGQFGEHVCARDRHRRLQYDENGFGGVWCQGEHNRFLQCFCSRIFDEPALEFPLRVLSLAFLT